MSPSGQTVQELAARHAGQLQSLDIEARLRSALKRLAAAEPGMADPHDLELIALWVRVLAVEGRTKQLEDAVEELRGKADQNSQNSSHPPSSDPPSAPSPSPKQRSGRQPGGQPGHEGHRRVLLPVAKENIQDVKPERCDGCGTCLHGEDPNPYRHQVVEAPEPKPQVAEWRLHALVCDKCGKTTRAELPAGVPRGGFGPRLIAVIGLLSGAYRLTKRLTVGLLSDLYGIPISLGSIAACEQIASEAVAGPVKQAREHVKEQTVKHADESSWFEGVARAKVWLWTVTTQYVTVFLIWASRGKDVAQRMLGEAFGVLVTDRWCAYAWWPLRWRQLCWAHIRRHFKAMSEARGEAKEIGEKLFALQEQLFELWHRVRDGTLKRSSFRVYAGRIRTDVRAWLRRGARCTHKKTATTCAQLLKLEPAMWTFVRVEGVEPTNNHGERAIRPGVIWRKLSFGTHSRWGSRFVERMLTVVYTLKQQDRATLPFLTKCVAAHMAGQPVTVSLLPTAA